MDATESQVPIENSAADLDSFSLRIVDPVDNETMDAAESEVPVEKIATELDSFILRIVDPIGSKTSPDWSLSDGLYDDLKHPSVKSSPASSGGSFDNYLEIVKDKELDELDGYSERASANESRRAWMRNEAATATYRFCDDNDRYYWV